MKSKLFNTLETLSDLNEDQLEKDIATEMEEFTEKTMPTLTEIKEAAYEAPKTGTFADYSRAAMNFRRSIQVELSERHKRGQSHLTDTQQEALHRIAADLASILAYDPGDPVIWNSIANNADLGKG